MAYQRTEYHREVQRDTEDRDNKTSGWRSWFGLDNKDRDEDNRGYNYQSTTTYRNPHPSSYERTSYPERGPYTGARGGYGYTTSDEVSRGPSWTDRDYTTRPSYGQPTGERDVTYRQETRTYGGDRDWTRPTGDYTSRSYTPSRSYGYTGERDYPTRDYTTTSRDYPTTTSRDYPTTTSRDYPTTTSRDYPTSTYPSRGTYTSDYPSYPTLSRGYTTDYPTPSRGYTSDYPTPSRGYTSDYPTPSRGYTSDYPTPSRGYPSYDRDYTTPSRGYGFSGDRDTNTSSYPRPSYQPSSYRY